MASGANQVETMSWSWSNIAKFLLGFLLAIALLGGSGIAIALYFMTRASAPPPRPVFANDKTMKKTPPPTAATTPKPKDVSEAKSSDTPTSTESPSPTPSETPSPEPLEPGAYEARVNWPEGLLLRSEPSSDAKRIGGLENNQRIVVLEESADKNWQQVRLPNSKRVGWIKAGNIDRLDENQDENQ